MLLKRLGSDLFLIAASLMIAFVIWMIAKGGDITPKSLSVPLRLKNVPANVLARIEPSRVTVTLPVPNYLQSRLRPGMLEVSLDFNKTLPEPRSWCGIDAFRSYKQIQLESHHISVETQDPDLRHILERQLEFASIDSGEIVINGMLITRPAKLFFRTSGIVAPGYRLAGSIQPEDSRTILLTASRQVFDSLTQEEGAPVTVETEVIDLDGRSSSFNQTVGLKLPADTEPVFSEDRRVEARVEIEEITKVVKAVPVRMPGLSGYLEVDILPARVEVELRAPQEFLDRMRPEWIRIQPMQKAPSQPGVVENVQLEANWSFPPEVSQWADQVAVKSINPATVKLTLSEKVEKPVPAESAVEGD